MKIQGSVALVTGANRGLGAAFIDTDMARGAPGPKITPDDVVRRALAALEAGQSELLADATSRKVHAGLAAEAPVYLAAGA